MKECIGIDLGSNSLRGVRMNEKYQVLCEYEEVVRTSEGLEESGEICKNALGRIIAGLERMKKELRVTPKDKIVALTTQAMRQAKNNQEILKAIETASGICFKIIKGDEEAYITSLAPQIAIENLQKTNPKYKQDCYVLVDMGGASSEFIFCTKEGIFAKSFEIGIVKAKDKYKSIENLLECKDEVLVPIQKFIEENQKQGRKAKFLVANSGTPTMVCAFKMGLKQYDSKKVFGETLHRVDFRDELERFLSLSYKERENLVGVFRADVVPFGIVLFLLFMEILDFQECLILDEGVREGAAILGILDKQI